MANKHLHRRHHNVHGTKDVWWYEEPAGIILVAPDPAQGHKCHTIPWRTIRSALARKDKSDAK